MMDVFEAIQVRRSVRSYESAHVSSEKLRKILEAGRLAPSAMNIQPWHFIVVTDKEKRKMLAETGPYAKFLAESPTVIVGCGDPKASPKWYVVDVAIALQNMVLAATGEGLGTCWVGSFDESKVKELLKIPEHLRVIAILAVGFSKEKPKPKDKKTLREIVSNEEYGNFMPIH